MLLKFHRKYNNIFYGIVICNHNCFPSFIYNDMMFHVASRIMVICLWDHILFDISLIVDERCKQWYSILYCRAILRPSASYIIGLRQYLGRRQILPQYRYMTLMVLGCISMEYARVVSSHISICLLRYTQGPLNSNIYSNIYTNTNRMSENKYCHCYSLLPAP